MTDAINAYKSAYHFGATRLFFREFNPVRAAATFVYTNAGSGAVGATSGQVKVAGFAHKEFHYQPRALVSGSITVQVEGRASFMGTWTKLKRFSLTAADTAYLAATRIYERPDWMRIGIRAASPAATDRFTCYGIFR